MKKRILLLAMALCLLLGGCAPLTLEVEDLMRPPQLSESQRQIYDALLAALGTSPSHLNLCYPREGDHRSAFTFHDLDGDGQQEALVFYALAEAEEELFINVMEQGPEGWYSVCELPGAGSGVEQVAFLPVTQTEGCDIVIGWSSAQNSVGQLSVLRFSGSCLESLYQTRYTEYTTADLNGDGLQELVLVTMSTSGGRPFASLVTRRDGRLETVSNLPMNVNMTSISHLWTGWISDSAQGLVVDGYEGHSFTTEVFAIKDEVFSLPYPEKAEFYTRVTRREGTVCSEDIDGDRIVDFPMQEPVPGDSSLYYTVYTHLDENMELQPTDVALINQSQGYRFHLPEGWREEATVVQTKSGEAVFSAFDPETEEEGDELLRIRVYSEKDYRDKFDTKRYKQIGRRGNFRYYANLTAAGERQLSLAEVTELFEMI